MRRRLTRLLFLGVARPPPGATRYQGIRFLRDMNARLLICSLVFGAIGVAIQLSVMAWILGVAAVLEAGEVL